MTELVKIRRSYESGELDSLKHQLISFVRTQREEIWKFREREERLWRKPVDLCTAAKLLLLQVRSIDFKAEMHDQIRAMREACGTDRQPGSDSALLAWIQKHSPAWRGFRVLAIIYVFEQNRDMFLDLLQPSGRAG